METEKFKLQFQMSRFNFEELYENIMTKMRRGSDKISEYRTPNHITF